MGNGSEQIGPRSLTIPQRQYQSCSGCKFYDYHMIRSGRDPIYARDCRHPNVPTEHKFNSWMRGNLGDNSDTPDWCPVLKNKSLTTTQK